MVCPTVARCPRKRLGQAGEFQHQRTICGYRGVGCNVSSCSSTADRRRPGLPPEAPVSSEFLCVMGRSAGTSSAAPTASDAAARTPTWPTAGSPTEPWNCPPPPAQGARPRSTSSPCRGEQAVDIVASKAGARPSPSTGRDSGQKSRPARCTNEENYLPEVHALAGTNNVDHCAVSPLQPVTGWVWPLAAARHDPGTIAAGLRGADCILITGSSHGRESHPGSSPRGVVRAVMRWRLARRHRPAACPMVDHATLCSSRRRGGHRHLPSSAAVAYVIVLRRAWQSTALIEARTGEFRQRLRPPRWSNTHPSRARPLRRAGGRSSRPHGYAPGERGSRKWVEIGA